MLFSQKWIKNLRLLFNSAGYHLLILLQVGSDPCSGNSITYNWNNTGTCTSDRTETETEAHGVQTEMAGGIRLRHQHQYPHFHHRCHTIVKDYMYLEPCFLHLTLGISNSSHPAGRMSCMGLIHVWQSVLPGVAVKTLESLQHTLSGQWPLQSSAMPWCLLPL